MPRLFDRNIHALRVVVLFVATFGLLAAPVMPASAQNPVPLANQPLVPDAIAPGGPGFTLIVNGTGFVANSTVNWNGSPRATSFVSSSQLTAKILASDVATASTASVTVVNPKPGGGSSVPLFFPMAFPERSVSFSQADFPSAGGNINVVTADFNGDGKLDLASAVYYDSVLRIFLGDGDGTFSAGQVFSGCNPHDVVTGDFNGDGIVDLIVAQRGCAQVTMFFGNGDGTFTEGQSFDTGGYAGRAPYFMAVGDFNADGKLDLATANEDGNSISVLLGNGDGTFQTHMDYDIGHDSRGIATGDFNRDGHLDLAVGTNDNFAAILLGNGDGTFQPPVLYQLGGTISPCSYSDLQTPFIITADLNKDEKLDLAVPNTTGLVSVLLGNGDGTFQNVSTYPTGFCAVAIAAADFHGNGVLDLLTTNYFSSNISLLPGNGDGTFGPYMNYPGDDGARGFAVGDFNGDGRLDLAVGDQFVDSISIYLQNPPHTPIYPCAECNHH